MILTVSGWRAWTERTFIHQQLDLWLDWWNEYSLTGETLTLRVGEASGADAICRQHIELKWPGVDLRVYRADWDGEGKAAGPNRNRRMLKGIGDTYTFRGTKTLREDPTYGQLSTYLLAFPQPGLQSPARHSGTWNCIRQAVWRGVTVQVPGYRTEIVGDDE